MKAKCKDKLSYCHIYKIIFLQNCFLRVSSKVSFALKLIVSWSMSQFHSDTPTKVKLVVKSCRCGDYEIRPKVCFDCTIGEVQNMEEKVFMDLGKKALNTLLKVERGYQTWWERV